MFRLVRAVAAIAIVVVLVVQAKRVLQRDLDILNFLSYFTVLSNVAAAAVLAVLAIRPNLIRSTKFTMLRGMATLWMVTTAFFFTAWISPSIEDSLRHVVSPFVLLADWLLNPSPPLSPTRHTLMWLVPPALYVAYVLLRGPFVDWYPYLFLDPARRGYLAVGGFTLILMAIMAAISVLLTTWPGQVAKSSIHGSGIAGVSGNPMTVRLANTPEKDDDLASSAVPK